MVRLTGYKIVEKIYSSSETLVFRGIREKDEISVVIKFLRQDHPKFEKLVQFRNEYTIIKNLNIAGIIKTYGLENYENGYALVMEDFGGISLQEKIKEWGEGGMGSSAAGLKEFFTIALQIVSILEALHHQRVIHKDIKTANILIKPKTLEVKLIDFSIACLLKRETQTLASPNVLEGTLSYLSPEQTGRINRLVDYRTDFYSLGVTFFELLTGELPFASNDPIELIHYHIAKQPPLLHDIHSHIPPILSAIIHKLMAKNAEYRYQSAHGIKYDLEMCIKAGEETGNIQTFELGKRDISDRLTIPEKLYGREVEVKTLLTAFERICANNKEIILVVGYSGIGKTAVVNEVHKPIVCVRGYFIKGKFDQFQRNIPFFAFIQAFRNLIDQLLTESDAQLQEWKTKILSALGENAQVIIAVIPELEQIIGKQPPVPELSTMATENRFNLLFEKFIHVFTTQKHPLVIFLDDLQWVDLASLKLMQLLMTTNEISYLLLIGAYRDNEVSATDPLILTIENIRKTASIINTIPLNSLNQSDLNQLIADTLNCPTTVALPFTQLVYLKTQGNPFFSQQFIKSLYEDGLISFNFDCRYWQCDIAQIQALAISNDVVEFMALQLQKLPESTQSVLKLAACIGNQFNLDTLAKINEKSQIETAVDLWKALLEEFIIPTTKIYNFFQNEIASLYMTKAYYGYLRWGGKAKVDHLEKSYPQLLAKTLQAGKKPVSMMISKNTKNNNISEAIDLNAVIKFSQVIASEIHIDKLLLTLMQVMIENSGATKSVLILVKNNHLFVEAVKIDNATVVQESIPVNLSKDIPINVINYVYNTAKIFVTDDIKTNLLIAADSYIVSQQPKSLLCLPIIHKSKLMGILYLENQLTLGAFTYNKIEVLNLLMTQAAISLENAQLYTNLSEQADSLKQANQQLEEYAMTLKITNRLQKLADLSLAINSTLSTNNILQLVTQQAAEIIGAHQSIISIKIDESCTKAVHTVHLADKYEQWRENYEKFDESDFYRLGCQIQNSMRMTQTELEAHPAAINNNLPLRGWLVAPLIDIKGKHIGFMHLSDKYEGDFTEDDEAILVQLAQMVLLAMNNAHLYEESQRANRIKDEFLAVLSHELRSPLTSIIGWSQMLQSGKLSPEKTAIALETIERNAKSQTQLIEDVVDISRMVQGNMSLNIQPVNLVSPIETAINTMYLAAKAKSIKILLTIASHDVMVLGDPIRLQQIVWNLLTNAIKFTSPGGQVEIGLKTVGSEAQIQVIDTGSGISPDFMPYIFDYFRQADASNTRNYGGLGLGLAIVRHLVELHGGNIWAKSLGKGQGATFTVRIPLLQSQPEPNPLSKSLNNSPNLTIDGVKVLVVDDNVDVREFLVFALEEYGAVVMTAASVREALKCLQQFPADILITDIGMPEENGYSLLNQIRSLESTQKRQIPAIALTGYTANEVINQVLNAGFQKYLPKPIDVFELITAISQLI